MHYLIAAILSSFAIAMLVKWNETADADRRVVIASNYITGSALGCGLLLSSGDFSVSGATLLLGVGGGVLWPGTFVLLMWGTRRYGVYLAGAACRLALVVPVLFGLSFLGEPLSRRTLLGLTAAFTAFYLFQPARTVEQRTADYRAIGFLLLLAFCFGWVDLWVNLFNHVAPEREKFAFLTLVFLFSNGFAWGYLLIRRHPVDRKSFLRGLLLGWPNFFASYFLMESLKTPLFVQRSADAYTLYSVSGLMLTFLAGVFFWKEPVSRFNVAGMGMALLSIVLLRS